MTVTTVGAERAREDRATATSEPSDSLSKLGAQEEHDLRRRLARWAVRFLGLPEAEFDDAYQGAWRKLLEGRRNGRPVRNLEHALRWAIHNCWLEECRRRRRRPTVPFDECTPSDFRRTSGADPIEQIERLEAARHLFEAARTIDEVSWRMVLLRDLWGLSPAEVCESLGIAGRTYRRKHARALVAIHSRLAPALAEAECADRRDALRAVATGTASSFERQQIKRHTRRCATCRRALAALSRGGGTACSSAHGLDQASRATGEGSCELSAVA